METRGSGQGKKSLQADDLKNKRRILDTHIKVEDENSVCVRERERERERERFK